MNNSKLTFKDLDIVSIEDVDKVFNKLSQWDKSEFISKHIKDFNGNLYELVENLYMLLSESDQIRLAEKYNADFVNLDFE